MSNNVISQQFPIQGLQIGQLEPILNKMDSPLPEMRMMGTARSVSSNNTVSQQFLISNKQTEPMESISNNPVSQGLSAMNFQMGQMEAHANRTTESQQFLTSNDEMGQMGSMLNNVGLQQLSTNFKRKAPMEPNPHNSMSHKRMAQMEHRPWLQQVSGSNKRVVQLESVPNAPASPHLPSPNKKTVKIESFSNKSALQRSSSQKNQNVQMQPSSKASTESSESVRSKMRESLAAALSLVDQLKNKPSNSQSEAGNSQVRTQENLQPGGSAFEAGNAESITEESKDTLHSIGSSGQKSNDVGGGSLRGFADVRTDDFNKTSVHDEREFQSCNVLPYDVSFSENLFVKDELLQGNGLSWVLDSDMQLTETKEIQASGKRNLDCGGVGGVMAEQATSNLQRSPQHLASKIEAELFKLFGGVNKKYKEKGRSLLFNLKDRNNPELRERVMSGEIPPERLCSMTAEELASKELSEWRMAKAEELAQMVVLPDSEVDIRRLVKKTHKGEFQVEVEQDNIVPAEVSVGTSSLGQSQTKSKDSTRTPRKPEGGKGQQNASGENSSSGEQNGSYTLTIPSSEGTDPMEGLMVDDGLKDAEFLPPIVSLDEFMESLDSEPPFENMPVDAAKMTPTSDKDDSEVGSELKSMDPTPKDTADASPRNLDNVDDNVAITHANLDADIKSNDSDLKSNDGDSDVNSRAGLAGKKSNDSSVESETALSSTQKGEQVWGGLLQLNISTTASVIGIFKSGEKTSAKEWPGFLEIKGRVKLDAFEKFLQELPLSRSRAVMVVHFVLKVGSPENEQASLKEVADSYIVDERVGFAEPAPGVELYFCPPYNKTLEMLGKIIQKEHIEAVNAIDNGLIGVIVWRKLTTTSPKSSSQHKHVSKKNHFSSRRHQDTNLNAKYTTPKSTASHGQDTTNPRPSPDDDDDIPPGFGPPASRDEDDLPEFNFSGGSNSSVPPFSAQNPSRGLGIASYRPPSQTSSRPVDQMRELVQRYGQPNTSPYPGNWQDKVGGSGVAVQPWNDDDDDIPEWQPHAPQQQQTPLQPVHTLQQPPMLRPHFVNQPHLVPSHQAAHQTLMPLQSLQPPINATKAPENHALWQHGGWWVPPVEGNNLRPEIAKVFGPSGQGINTGQPAMGWQQNAPTSRGF
ncbi:uncharacterized protein LOC107407331 [Ziziphus jujuba]|uniref:Uncharacterized protein LOC107407331 n=1 Tax=Ziziphus jujuba TaxID=326968 RepID=A0A6P3Z0P3_ZIZJJ|nr:uncharacterized protein LOC107407331 [Ziziphus jujuba]